MIIWIASYPKSGNTWIRAMLSAYFYSQDGNFNFELLDKIKEFPKNSKYLNKISKEKNLSEIAKEWIPAQKMLNLNAKNKSFEYSIKKNQNIQPKFFLKTHSAICSINGHDFTNNENTLAAVYIVRDPRNVVLSISNHFNISIENSLEFMIDKNKIISNPTNENENIGLTLLSDWKTNYQSWKNYDSTKVKIVKYEDLLNSSKNIFVDILNFFNKYAMIDIDEDKIKNVIKSTEFNKLKEYEQKYGFKESAAMSDQSNFFFNLGPNNDWKKLLDKKISEKICEYFKSEMKELGYIT